MNIAKTKKPHTIGETLIKPCLECAQLLLDKNAVNKFNEISMSDNTINSLIND